MGFKIDLKKTNIEGVLLGKINHYSDERGKFSRLFDFNDISKELNKPILEINLSQNIKKGTVRGLHFENTEVKSFKIIKCIKGEIEDKVVDIRKNSKTFLYKETFILNEKDNILLFIPSKVAHGFQTKFNDTQILYMHTMSYNPDIENGLNIFDPTLDIKWDEEISSISDRDKNFKFLEKNFNGI